MDRSRERRREIFKRTDGRCHICHGKLAFCNYGRFDERGGWEIEHSVPKCNGGTDRLSNLFPAHIDCNRSKGAGSTKAARRANGLSCAPLSAVKKEQIKSRNRWGWGAGVATVGALIFGFPGALIGGVAGTLIGDSINPE